MSPLGAGWRLSSLGKGGRRGSGLYRRRGIGDPGSRRLGYLMRWLRGWCRVVRHRGARSSRWLIHYLRRRGSDRRRAARTGFFHRRLSARWPGGLRPTGRSSCFNSRRRGRPLRLAMKTPVFCCTKAVQCLRHLPRRRRPRFRRRDRTKHRRGASRCVAGCTGLTRLPDAHVRPSRSTRTPTA